MVSKGDPYKQALREARKKNPRNDKVFALLNKSLRVGNPEAAYALGTWYLHGKHVRKNLRKAIRLLRSAAKKNVPCALYDMAVSYEVGVGIRRNAERAAEHYMRAALHGDKQSVFEVGRCYYYGVGVARDRRIAWAWLDRARDLGVSESSRPTG